jgi:hypothetical protein
MYVASITPVILRSATAKPGRVSKDALPSCPRFLMQTALSMHDSGKPSREFKIHIAIEW